MRPYRNRVAALESRIRPGRCPVCFDRPARIAFVHEHDPDGPPWHETFPAAGCPACGHSVVDDLYIVVPESDDVRETWPALEV